MIKQKIISAYEEMAEMYNELIDHKPHNGCDFDGTSFF